MTDDLQFGFKSAISCSQAVFTLRMAIEYFNSRGSTVYAAALDISEAFDTVCHSVIQIINKCWNINMDCIVNYQLVWQTNHCSKVAR